MANVQLAIAGDETTQVILSVPGVQGPAGSNLPPSGTTNQVLYKQSNTDYDTAWKLLTNDNVDAAAAIAGTKISPNFGSQNAVTTGTSTAASFIPTSSGVPANGLYLPSANNVAISTAGSGRLFVDPNGNIGVGGTSSTYRFDCIGNGISTRESANSSRLVLGTYDAGGFNYISADKIGTGSYQPLVFQVNGSEKMRITSTGLGVGASSPGVRLEVLDSIAGGSDNTIATLHNFSDTGGDTRYAGLNFRIGTDNGTSAIRAFRTNSANNYETNLSFWTNPSGATQTPVQRMTLDSTGRLGIGTTSPVALLQVGVGNTGSPGAKAIFNTANSTDAGIAISNWTGGGTTNGPRIAFDNSTVGTWSIGGGNNTNTFVIRDTGASSDRLTIDSSGRLLVGTSNAFTERNWTGTGWTGVINVSRNDVDGVAQFNNWSSNAALNTSGGTSLFISRCKSGTVGTQTGGGLASGDAIGRINFNGSDGSNFYTAAAIDVVVDAATSGSEMPGRLVFSTTADGQPSPTERMRITSAGRFNNVSTEAGIFSETTQAAGTSFVVFQGRYSATAGSPLSGTTSFQVYSNGNVENTNNSYGAISDIKLKENIVDANSQWDDLKALQVRNYNFKEGQTHTQIGLVAQEVELVSPGLVTESPDRDEEGNDLGTVTKSVNYSVLYMKAVKALQEAMERIEQLEQRLTDAGIA